MLELHRSRPMPHATVAHQPRDSFLPWPGCRNASKPNSLPPLSVPTSSSSSSGFSSAILNPALPSSAHAPPTPPEMNGVSIHNPLHPRGHLGLQAAELKHNSFAHGPHSQPSSLPPTDSANSYRSGRYGINSARQTASNASSVAVYNVQPPPSLASAPEQPGRKDSPVQSPIAPDLRVPSNVDTPQKSMPQLAAEVTCLFWFENGADLKKIADAPAPVATPFPYIPDAKPIPGFRKWVATLLSTTQVKQNVVMLALLFIYRLKKANPTVKGKPGSEYRLLTVALMLGNKFLDDNTYTNKTWADVSGISPHEVHIMEVEFLSNMRYSLYVSEAEWNAWHVTLGRFGTYIYRAIQSWDAMSRPAALLSTGLNVPAALPSPPASSLASPQGLMNLSPSHVTRTSTPLLHPQVGSAGASPIRPLPEIDLRPAGRKRSYDESAQEPPAKRHAPNYLNQLPQPTMAPFTYLPTPQGPFQPRASATSISNPAPSVPAPTLPGPHVAPHLQMQPRAMSLVFQPSTTWSQTTAIPAPIPPLQTTSLPTQSGPQLRQLSPFPPSEGSSPINAPFAGAGTPFGHGRLSPSYYLAQRSSPYKPVRRPHTLLAPPPSIALNNPARRISLDQMQYHSLGRPITERNYGHLPYNAWPHTQPWTELPPLPTVSNP